jgi:hypothetical protein
VPFKSEAQRRYFMANRAKLEAQGVDVGEWARESKGKSLPERVLAEKSAMPVLVHPPTRTVAYSERHPPGRAGKVLPVTTEAHLRSGRVADSLDMQYGLHLNPFKIPDGMAPLSPEAAKALKLLPDGTADPATLPEYLRRPA